MLELPRRGEVEIGDCYRLPGSSLQEAYVGESGPHDNKGLGLSGRRRDLQATARKEVVTPGNSYT